MIALNTLTLSSTNRRKIGIVTNISKASIPCLILQNVSKIKGITNSPGPLFCQWQLYSCFFPTTRNQIFKTSNQGMHAILKSRSPITFFFFISIEDLKLFNNITMSISVVKRTRDRLRDMFYFGSR